MTKNEFKALVVKLVDTYGVRSYLDNIEAGMTQEEIDDDLWVMCSECDDVVAYDDWADDEEMAEGKCPICGQFFFDPDEEEGEDE